MKTRAVKNNASFNRGAGYAAAIAAFLPYLALAGVAAGLLAGLFGIGGGAVLVPVLLTMLTSLQVPTSDAMAMALATSLACIVPTAVSSSYSHFKNTMCRALFLNVGGWAF